MYPGYPPPPQRPGTPEWIKATIVITIVAISVLVGVALVLIKPEESKKVSQQPTSPLTPTATPTPSTTPLPPTPGSSPTTAFSTPTAVPPPPTPIPTPIAAPIPAPTTQFLRPVPNSPQSATQLLWTSSSGKTRLPGLDRACYGQAMIGPIETTFSQSKVTVSGKIRIFNPRSNGCQPGENLDGEFEVSGPIGTCKGRVDIHWLANNRAKLFWQIANRGSSCQADPAPNDRWQIETYPVQL